MVHKSIIKGPTFPGATATRVGLLADERAKHRLDETGMVSFLLGAETAVVGVYILARLPIGLVLRNKVMVFDFTFIL